MDWVVSYSCQAVLAHDVQENIFLQHLMYSEGKQKDGNCKKKSDAIFFLFFIGASLLGHFCALCVQEAFCLRLLVGQW